MSNRKNELYVFRVWLKGIFVTFSTVILIMTVFKPALSKIRLKRVPRMKSPKAKVFEDSLKACELYHQLEDINFTVEIILLSKGNKKHGTAGSVGIRLGDCRRPKSVLEDVTVVFNDETNFPPEILIWKELCAAREAIEKSKYLCDPDSCRKIFGPYITSSAGLDSLVDIMCNPRNPPGLRLLFFVHFLEITSFDETITKFSKRKNPERYKETLKEFKRQTREFRNSFHKLKSVK